MEDKVVLVAAAGRPLKLFADPDHLVTPARPGGGALCT